MLGMNAVAFTLITHHSPVAERKDRYSLLTWSEVMVLTASSDICWVRISTGALLCSMDQDFNCRKCGVQETQSLSVICGEHTSHDKPQGYTECSYLDTKGSEEAWPVCFCMIGTAMAYANLLKAQGCSIKSPVFHHVHYQTLFMLSCLPGLYLSCSGCSVS